MSDIDALTALYDHLNAAMGPAVNLDDLLRSKIVYSVSAFDKLIHDIVTAGMVDIFLGVRPATPKFLAEPIPMSLVQAMRGGATAPPEFIFEQAIRAKLKFLSFQDPEKISDGLSYIWIESQKWQKIAAEVGRADTVLKTTLKLIVGRRNAIVHEADTDPITNQKTPINRQEAADIVSLLRILGEAIHRLVT